jgi:hypothetical protein
MVDAKNNTQNSAFDHVRLMVAIEKQELKLPGPYYLPLDSPAITKDKISFQIEQTQRQHDLVHYHCHTLFTEQSKSLAISICIYTIVTLAK